MENHCLSFFQNQNACKRLIGFFLLPLFFLDHFHLVLAQERKQGEQKGGKPPLIAKPFYLDLGTFIVNMPGDKYYLKSSIQLAFAEDAPKVWLEQRMPLVKDLVIRYLQSITVQQFDEVSKRQFLKRNLQIRINSLFPNNPIGEDVFPVRKILFSEFYRQ